ncbi:LytTR family DNA-binding domain-containing protein [Candidatus Enterococcus mansonii]|uniref:HTH LytTR-type domain-containing protein n=1 Tax=Candidatus Enterococcus mansonii TaxID=1834181 RepID=A0A242CCN3_9ENTE|nr:LytTR family DNA-binding domain-containing protein [Enterococcus sp. 4G2_DIV0659]OTO08007.1 hypothetical protein A5880_002277 [Enterococcus sp. 4G2_DIV0659]
MKTSVEFIDSNEEELAKFKVHKLTPALENVLAILNKEDQFLLGEEAGSLYKLPISDILYIEVVDKKSFIYTQDLVCQSSDKLYQLEEQLAPFKFIRTSKSMLLNIEAIKAISPTFSGRFEALLTNEERVAISRKYVPDLKKGLGMERKK